MAADREGRARETPQNRRPASNGKAGPRSVSADLSGDSFIGEILVHTETAKANSPALDIFLGVHLEAVVFEESSGSKTHVRGDSRDTSGNQGGLDAV